MNLSSTLQIKEATDHDVPLILEFIKALAEYEKLLDKVEASEDRIRKTIFGEEPRAKFVLAYQDDVAIGFAVFFYTYSTFLAQPGLYLEDIYVRREARGRGVGRALFRYLAAVAKENGCSRIDWAVLRWNESAVGFYTKLGALPVDDWTVYRLTGEALDRMAGNDQH